MACLITSTIKRYFATSLSHYAQHINTLMAILGSFLLALTLTNCGSGSDDTTRAEEEPPPLELEPIQPPRQEEPSEDPEPIAEPTSGNPSQFTPGTFPGQFGTNTYVPGYSNQQMCQNESVQNQVIQCVNQGGQLAACQQQAGCQIMNQGGQFQGQTFPGQTMPQYQGGQGKFTGQGISPTQEKGLGNGLTFGKGGGKNPNPTSTTVDPYAGQDPNMPHVPRGNSYASNLCADQEYSEKLCVAASLTLTPSRRVRGNKKLDFFANSMIKLPVLWHARVFMNTKKNKVTFRLNIPHNPTQGAVKYDFSTNFMPGGLKQAIDSTPSSFFIPHDQGGQIYAMKVDIFSKNGRDCQVLLTLTKPNIARVIAQYQGRAQCD